MVCCPEVVKILTNTKWRFLILKELEVRALCCNVTANYMILSLIDYQHSSLHVQKGGGEEDRCGFRSDRFYGEHVVLLYGGVTFDVLLMVPRDQAGGMVS